MRIFGVDITRAEDVKEQASLAQQQLATQINQIREVNDIDKRLARLEEKCESQNKSLSEIRKLFYAYVSASILLVIGVAAFIVKHFLFNGGK